MLLGDVIRNINILIKFYLLIQLLNLMYVLNEYLNNELFSRISLKIKIKKNIPYTKIQRKNLRRKYII